MSSEGSESIQSNCHTKHLSYSHDPSPVGQHQRLVSIGRGKQTVTFPTWVLLACDSSHIEKKSLHDIKFRKKQTPSSTKEPTCVNHVQSSKLWLIMFKMPCIGHSVADRTFLELMCVIRMLHFHFGVSRKSSEMKECMRDMRKYSDCRISRPFLDRKILDVERLRQVCMRFL